MSEDYKMINSSYLQINSIYKATEGEGKNLGRPQIFVRVQGCNVHCKNCDSCDTWSFCGGSTLSLDEIVAEVKKLSLSSINWVSITGGDPLDSAHVDRVTELISRLKSIGFMVNIEVTGLKINSEVFDLVDFISADFKTPSSGVGSDISNIKFLADKFINRFQIKSVVETREDFNYISKAYDSLKKLTGGVIGFWWGITPAYLPKEEFPRERFINVNEWNLEVGRFHVVGQQHKWLHGPDSGSV
jgi:7-carboxy-7-deazaguanine synthase